MTVAGITSCCWPSTMICEDCGYTLLAHGREHPHACPPEAVMELLTIQESLSLSLEEV